MDSFSMSLRNVTTTSNMQTTRAMEGLATSLKNVTKAAAALTAAANAAAKGSSGAAANKPGAGTDAGKAAPAAAGVSASATVKGATGGTDKTQAEDKDKAKKRPLQAYADAHDKTPADDVNAAVASAFPELEKQLIGLSTTGKANFDALGKQLLAGLSRVAIEDVVTRPLATAMDGWIKDLFGNYAPDKKDDKKDADSVSGAAAAAGVNSVAGAPSATKDGRSKDGDATKDQKDKIETLQDYIKSVGTTSDEINKAFGKTFTAMEDQLVAFVTTGKANFKSLADSIIADLARVAVRQGLSYLGSSLLSAFGGAGSGTAGLSVLEGSAGMGDATSAAAMSLNAYTGGYIREFANGGYTGDGGKYEAKAIVHGGEYVFDKDSTQRLGVSYLEGLRAGAPMDADGPGAIILQPSTAAGGININTNITVAGADSDGSDGDGGASDARQLGTLINQQVRSVLVQESRQGGVLWNIRNGYGN